MKHIKIWRFDDAPKKYKKYFDNDDDADWLAFIPNYLFKKEGNYIPFLEEGTAFGCCCVEKKKLKNGEIWVGYHS